MAALVQNDLELLDDRADDLDPVVLPYEYAPRHYQKPIWSGMFPDAANDPVAEAVRRAVLVWHRRAGKDKTVINLIVAKAMERVGTYLYLLPKQNQARKVIWKGMDKDGFRFIDHIPADLIAYKNSTDMLVELVNGSIIQLGGSDNYDAWMGTNPVGIVFSEYSIQDPYAWEYFRPILAENGGWAIFIYTPRGHNHGYTLYRRALKRARQPGSGWFVQLLTADDTDAISPEAIQDEREDGMSEQMVEQEFFCSFEAFNEGAVYGRQMQAVWKEERIGFFPPEPGVPVHTVQDLGVNDSNVIWFFQVLHNEVRLVHYYENHGQGMGHYIEYMREWCRARELRLGDCWAPHDIKVREYESGRRRIDIAAEDYGMDFAEVPNIPKVDGHEAARVMLRKCRFHEEDTAHGIACLEDYHYEFDEKRKTYKTNTAHNWASNGADAFRYLAVVAKNLVSKGADARQGLQSALSGGQRTSPYDA